MFNNWKKYEMLLFSYLQINYISSVILLIVIMLIIMVSSCANTEHYPDRHRVYQHNKQLIPNLFVYDSQDISNYLNKYNVSGSYYTTAIKRNSSGNCLYIYQYDEKTANNDYRILVASTGKPIKELKQQVQKVELNDQAEVVAWLDKQQQFHIRDNYTTTIPQFGTFEVDSTGQYFFTTFKSGTTDLFSITNPTNALVQVKYSGRAIFYSNNRIYLFGDAPNYTEIICSIFKQVQTEIELEQEIHIPRLTMLPLSSPFTIVDFDLITKNALIIDVRDEPLSSRFFLYNLNTATMEQVFLSDQYKYIGFLQGDILEVVKP